MDAYEATRIVFSRIQSLDPENATKIMGLLLLQDHSEKEMIRLAFGAEALLHSLVLKARKDLGLGTPSAPGSPSAAGASPFLIARQNSASNSSRLLPPLPLAVSSPPSWAPPPVFSRSSNTNSNGAIVLNGALDDIQSSDELISPSNPNPSRYSNGGGAGGGPGGDLIDELQLQDQLSFLNEPAAGGLNDNHSLPVGNGAAGELFYRDVECQSPGGGSDDTLFPYGMGLGINGCHQRRSASADLCLGSDASGFSWKPCLYFARGFCKNGIACRFLHGLPDETAAAAAATLVGTKMNAVEQHYQELLMRSKSQNISATSQLMASAFPYSPTGSVSPSPSMSSKCLNFLLQQQQNESQRAAAAAAAAALMLGGDGSHKLMARSRLERDLNPVSRQIYLTFPADSTFREEDVSNYFSIYGPVQDVRIPYQQKRMFGFVTFVYPETVKLILAKGNPHFVCDARVLVKPYKEKGKVPDKYRKQQVERGDFPGCTTPNGLDLDSRGDPYDFQQLGARMLYNSSSSQELLRRRLEEQQAAELQRAIELQGRRFMSLRLLDLKNRSLCSSAPSSFNSTTISTSPTISISDGRSSGSSNNNSHGGSPTEDKSPAGVGSAAQDQKVSSCHGFLHQTAVSGDDKEESGGEGNSKGDSYFEESVEHNLPDSPFASSTKSSAMLDPFAVVEADFVAPNAVTTGTTSSSYIINNNNGSSNNHQIASTLLPPSSTLDMASFKSCFFQMPRFSSDHGAIGM